MFDVNCVRVVRINSPAVPLDDLRRFLLTQCNQELVHIIMQQVPADDRLRESLLMKVARQWPEGLDLVTFRSAIDSPTDTGGFVHLNSASGFALGRGSVRKGT